MAAESVGQAQTRFGIALAREGDLELPAKEGAVDTDPIAYPTGVVFRKVIQIQHFREDGEGPSDRLRPPFVVFPSDAMGSDRIVAAFYSVRLNDERNRVDGTLDRHPVSREWDGDRWFIPVARFVDVADANPSDRYRLVLDLQLASGRVTHYQVDLRLRSPLPKIRPMVDSAFEDVAARRVAKANARDSESKHLPVGAWIVAQESYTNPSRTRDMTLWVRMKGEWNVESVLALHSHHLVRTSVNHSELQPIQVQHVSRGRAVPYGIRILRNGAVEDFIAFDRDGVQPVPVRVDASETVTIGWVVGPAATSSACVIPAARALNFSWNDTRTYCGGPRGDRSCDQYPVPRSATAHESWGVRAIRYEGRLEREAWLSPVRLDADESRDLRQELEMSGVAGTIASPTALPPAPCQGLY